MMRALAPAGSHPQAAPAERPLHQDPRLLALSQGWGPREPEPSWWGWVSPPRAWCLGVRLPWLDQSGASGAQMLREGHSGELQEAVPGPAARSPPPEPGRGAR